MFLTLPGILKMISEASIIFQSVLENVAHCKLLEGSQYTFDVVKF